MTGRASILLCSLLASACLSNPDTSGRQPVTREVCAVDTSAAAIAVANDQRLPAGWETGDTVEVLLDVRPAILVPEEEDGPHLPGAAFGVPGQAPSIPGPLIRADAGTVLRADVCNTLSDTVWLVGFGAEGDTVTVAPGQNTVITTSLARQGMRDYRGITREGENFRRAGPNGQLAGAIVVDGEKRWGDRVLVITDWAPAFEGEDFAFLVNGKSWPHTERLRYAVADTARWIVVNASPLEHPMHLHGFHFEVIARSTPAEDSVYAPGHVREAVTETLRPGDSMAMEWVPQRGGRWLFHCHVASHMNDGQRFSMLGIEPPESLTHHGTAEQHAREAMAGLVMGIEVTGDPAIGLARGAALRRERLLIQSRPGVYGPDAAFGYVLQEGEEEPAPDSVAIPGPALILHRDEPVEFVVVNRMHEPTSVHWHGLEIESYFDGVPGWTGDVQRTTPLIAPGDSFIVRLTPPRAGTFIYHAHADELRQLGAGLFGGLVVLEPGAAWDPASDHLVIFSMQGPDIETAPIVANDDSTAVLDLEAGTEHRIRFINISPDDLVDLTLLAGPDTASWRVVARDGADSPPALARPAPARLVMGPGETVDVRLMPMAKGDLRLAVTSFNDFVVTFRVR